MKYYLIFSFLLFNIYRSKEEKEDKEKMNFKKTFEICSKSTIFHNFGHEKVCLGKKLRETTLMNFHIDFVKNDKRRPKKSYLFHGENPKTSDIEYMLTLNEELESTYYDYVNSCCEPKDSNCIESNHKLQTSKGCKFAKAQFLENVKDLNSKKKQTDFEYWNPLINESKLEKISKSEN